MPAEVRSNFIYVTGFVLGVDIKTLRKESTVQVSDTTKLNSSTIAGQ